MISIAVSEESQVGSARRTAIQIAQGAGLSSADLDRLAIVVTEAATNLVRHAVGGELLVEATGSGEKACMRVIAVDEGPGIANVEAAMVDGFSTAEAGARGIGAGLGSMRRQADRFDLHSSPSGTTLIAHVGALPKPPAKACEVAGLIVPKPGFSEGGDVWAVRHNRDETIVMLTDVLGHGPSAARDAALAREAFAKATRAGLEASHQAVAHAMEGSRGAAALFVEIPNRPGTLRAIGLGNVKGDIVGPGNARHGIPSQPGILGASTKPLRASEHEWADASVLVLSTDGLRTSLKIPEPAPIYFKSAEIIAATLYKLKRRGSDDAGIVVARA